MESITRSYISAHILSAPGMEPQNQATQTLTRQGYHLVGSGAVKPCLWLNRAMRGGDQCYKHHFYGISSHRCVQMTPTLECNHHCLHCWRPIDDPVPGNAAPGAGGAIGRHPARPAEVSLRLRRSQDHGPGEAGRGARAQACGPLPHGRAHPLSLPKGAYRADHEREA